jgi:hypothetical protein
MQCKQLPNAFGTNLLRFEVVVRKQIVRYGECSAYAAPECGGQLARFERGLEGQRARQLGLLHAQAFQVLVLFAHLPLQSLLPGGQRCVLFIALGLFLRRFLCKWKIDG